MFLSCRGTAESVGEGTGVVANKKNKWQTETNTHTHKMRRYRGIEGERKKA